MVENYHIKMSKTEHEVPVVNDVHLHSIYNPIKEAEQFVESNLNLLSKSKRLLILGAGFGYHIKAIKNYLAEVGPSDYGIVVVEPKMSVYSDMMKYNPINDRSVMFYVGQNIHEVYNDPVFIDFLINKPAVIPHPASFNLYSSFFKEFLGYKADTSTKDVSKRVKNKEVKEYIEVELNADQDLISAIESRYNQAQQLQSNDFILQAFAQLVRTEGRYQNV